MAIYRIKDRKGKPFVQVSKEAVGDSRLSWKARGILLYLLSKPDDFTFYLDELTTHASDGIDSLRSGIKELQKYGYVKRYASKDKGKIVAWKMDVLEIPELDYPHMEKPEVGNPTLIIKELNNKDIKDINLYAVLPNDDLFLNIYMKHFKTKIGKPHMKVSEEQFDHIMKQINLLRKYDITEEVWEEQVREHFENLPEKNNGNILAFIKATHRYFEVSMYDQYN